MPLIALDDPAALEPAAVGGKAAALARARLAGLPVLPGYVLPVPAAEPAVAAAVAAIGDRGPAAARRAVLGLRLDPGLVAALAAAVRELGGRVIVRSSSPLEGDPVWAGAFASLSEIGPADVATAVRSCWASAVGPDPLGRAARLGVGVPALALGILLQPELRPTAGGLARVLGDRVQLTAVAGHPARLLAGWATGETGFLDGQVRTGRSPVSVLTGPVADAVGALARRVAGTLGHDTIEWAVVGSAVYLLQSTVGHAHPDRAGPAPAGRAATDRTGTEPAAAGRVAGSGGTVDTRVAGMTAVPGHAAGALRYARPHHPQPAPDAGILVCDRPVPALAPLLFGARGLVSLTGPADCHLVGVARSLGVPTLVGVPVERVTGPLAGIAGRWRAAIDGDRAELVLLPQPPDRPPARAATSSLQAGPR